MIMVSKRSYRDAISSYSPTTPIIPPSNVECNGGRNIKCEKIVRSKGRRNFLEFLSQNFFTVMLNGLSLLVKLDENNYLIW